MTAVLLWELDEGAATGLAGALREILGAQMDVVSGRPLAELPQAAVGRTVLHLVGADTAVRALVGLTADDGSRLGGEALLRLLPETDPPDCVVLDSCYQVDQAKTLAGTVPRLIGLPARMGRGNADAFLLRWYRRSSGDGGPDDVVDQALEESSALDLPEELQPQLHGFEDADVSLRRDTAEASQVKVWYGTNRVPRADALLYGEADDTLHQGSCSVTVPKAVRLGRTRLSPLQRLTSPGGPSGFTLTQHRTLTAVAQWDEVRQALAADPTGRRSVLLYIHGYRTTFVEAALRAAQLHADLKVPGVTAFYSWPSSGNTGDYWADEDAVQHGERYLCEFLRELCLHSGANNVNVLAHSMGNRALLRVAMRAAEGSLSTQGVRLGQVILAAADVGRRFFQTEALSYHTVADGVTMYTSSRDQALRSSAIVHKGPRAGFTPPPTTIAGIDTIDASRIDLSLLGHGYYAAARPVLADIHAILYGQHAPGARIGLEQDPTTGSWIFRR
ncbi:alpha/beta hydrolase [Streptomyces sp. NPDC096132]|uniref:alpha/beta hydrolase n=1 Tax=Streptomyces sp. NPDC096132 TaxID=3366075 RepID=UPI00381CDA3B